MKKKRITFTNGPQPDTVRKCWNIITGAGSDSAEITLYGDVCSQHPTDWWTGEPLPGQYITPRGLPRRSRAYQRQVGNRREDQQRWRRPVHGHRHT